MEINKIDAIRLSDFEENEKVFVTIMNNGNKIIVEGLSSLDKDFIEDEGLNELGVGEMTRSFSPDEEVQDDFMVIVRMR
jgi:hypothetical protein